MKVSNAVLAGIGATPVSSQDSVYPPVQHFSRIGGSPAVGGLSLNASSYSNSTSSAAAPEATSPTYEGTTLLAGLPSSSMQMSSETSLFTGFQATSPLPSAPSTITSTSAIAETSSSAASEASTFANGHFNPFQPTDAFPLPSDFSLLPTASLPTYITTVTLANGTSSRFQTIFSNCGNGTMLVGPGFTTATGGSSYTVVPVTATDSSSPQPSLWYGAPESGKVPPTPISLPAGASTLPCSKATGIAATTPLPVTSAIDDWGLSAVPTPPSSAAAQSASSSSSHDFWAQTTGGASNGPEQEESSASSIMKRSMIWMVVTLMLAASWPC